MGMSVPGRTRWATFIVIRRPEIDMNDPDNLGRADLEQARQVLQIEIHELERLASRLDQRFSEAVLILRKTVEAGRKIIVLGVGKSGQIGEKIAATLTS